MSYIVRYSSGIAVCIRSPCISFIWSFNVFVINWCCLTREIFLNSSDSTTISYMAPQPPDISATLMDFACSRRSINKSNAYSNQVWILWWKYVDRYLPVWIDRAATASAAPPYISTGCCWRRTINAIAAEMISLPGYYVYIIFGILRICMTLVNIDDN